MRLTVRRPLAYTALVVRATAATIFAGTMLLAACTRAPSGESGGAPGRTPAPDDLAGWTAVLARSDVYDLQHASARPLAEELAHLNGPDFGLGSGGFRGFVPRRLHESVPITFTALRSGLGLYCLPHLRIRFFL